MELYTIVRLYDTRSIMSDLDIQEQLAGLPHELWVQVEKLILYFSVRGVVSGTFCTRCSKGFSGGNPYQLYCKLRDLFRRSTRRKLWEGQNDKRRVKRLAWRRNTNNAGDRPTETRNGACGAFRSPEANSLRPCLAINNTWATGRYSIASPGDSVTSQFCCMIRYFMNGPGDPSAAMQINSSIYSGKELKLQLVLIVHS